MKKTYLALTGLTLAVCAAAFAQESGDRVVVPARNTTHPREVHASLTHGTITVKTHTGKDVIVETSSSRGSRASERTYDGLKRIDLPPRGLTVEEDDNVIRIRSSVVNPANITITVPPDTSVHLRSTQGDLTVEGVHGEIEVSSTQGEIRLTNVSGSVVASTSNGSIKVAMDRVDSGKPLSFSSHNGDVDVTLPADIKANLKLRSLHGEIYSDFEIKLDATKPTTESSGGRGIYRVQLDRTILGTINGGGGTDASFYTLNGKILIKKKK